MSVNDSVPPFPVVPVAQILASDFQPRYWQGGVVFQQLVARGSPIYVRSHPSTPAGALQALRSAGLSRQEGFPIVPLRSSAISFADRPPDDPVLRRFASSSPSRRTAPCRDRALPAISVARGAQPSSRGPKTLPEPRRCSRSGIQGIHRSRFGDCALRRYTRRSSPRADSPKGRSQSALPAAPSGSSRYFPDTDRPRPPLRTGEPLHPRAPRCPAQSG